MPMPQRNCYTEEDYYALPEDVRAELIDGELIYNQASPSRIHQAILSELHATIHQYIKSKNGSCHIYPAPFAVQLKKDRKTIVEPDISVICDSSKLTDKGCTGAPDWIIEIVSSGNPSHDYIKKLELYADTGVREYWIVDSRTEQIFVYCLEQTDIKPQAYTFHDKVKVNIYDDFWIDFEELEFF